MRRRRKGTRPLRFVVLGLAPSVVAGCVPSDPVTHLGAVRTDSKVELIIPLCEGELVKEVFLTSTDDEDGDGPYLWRVVADEPRALPRVEIGSVPDGFKADVGLREGALAHEVWAWVRTDLGEIESTLDASRMEVGQVYADQEEVPLDDVTEQSCD
jgi:hypothetical protein